MTATQDRESLFNSIIAEGFDIGSFEEFNTKMNDPQSRKNLFQQLALEGYELDGGYDAFEARIGGNGKAEYGTVVDEILKTNANENPNNLTAPGFKSTVVETTGIATDPLPEPVVPERPIGYPDEDWMINLQHANVEREEFHASLHNAGINLGPSKDFVSLMDNPEARKAIYDYVFKGEDPEGGYELFESRLGYGTGVGSGKYYINEIGIGTGHTSMGVWNQPLDVMPPPPKVDLDKIMAPGPGNILTGVKPASEIPVSEGGTYVYKPPPSYEEVKEGWNFHVDRFNTLIVDAVVQGVMMGRTEDMMDSIDEYFNYYKSEGNIKGESMTADDFLVGLGHSATRLLPGLLDMTVRATDSKEGAKEVGLELLELVGSIPGMAEDVIVGSGVIHHSLLPGHDAQDVQDAQVRVGSNFLDYFLILSGTGKVGIKAKQGKVNLKNLKKVVKESKGYAYFNEFIIKADWYRKLTIKERGIVPIIVEDIAQYRHARGSKLNPASDADLVRRGVPHYHQYLRERDMASGRTSFDGTPGGTGGFEVWLDNFQNRGKDWNIKEWIEVYKKGEDYKPKRLGVVEEIVPEGIKTPVVETPVTDPIKPPGTIDLSKVGEKPIIPKKGEVPVVKGEPPITEPVVTTEGGLTKIYHGTDQVFDIFDLDKSADGTVWFTDKKSSIEKGEVTASGEGVIMERFIDENNLKLGGWEEYDSKMIPELIQEGYDGLKLYDEQTGETTYQIFNPDILKTKEPVVTEPGELITEVKMPETETPLEKIAEQGDLHPPNKPDLFEEGYEWNLENGEWVKRKPGEPDIYDRYNPIDDPTIETPTVHKFSDSALEERFSNAEKGVPKIGVVTKVVDNAKAVVHSITRKYPTLPEGKAFAQANLILRKLEAEQNASAEISVRNIDTIVKDLSVDDFKIFQRLIILRDLKTDMDAGRPLTLGFSKETLTKELASLEEIAQNNPVILEALKNRKEMVESVLNELVEYGILDKELIDANPDYFHHQVLLYAEGRAGSTTTSELSKPQSNYSKKRLGTELDINANYLQAENAYLVQAYNDIAVAKAIKEFDTHYNIIEKTKADYLAENGTLEGWEKSIPEGYSLWQPDKGNVFYTGKTITESAMNEIMVKFTERIDVESIKGDNAQLVKSIMEELSDGLMVGGKKPQMLLPDEIVKTLTNLRPQADKNAGMILVQKLVRGWKKWILLNPKRVVKYNLNNMSGDLDAVIVWQPKVLLKVPLATSILMDASRFKTLPESYYDAMQRGVFDSGFSTNEVGDINQMQRFFRLMDKNYADVLNAPPQYIWRKVRGMTTFRENITRYASYLQYLEQLESGMTVKDIGYGATHPKMFEGITDNKDIASILARGVVGDYGNLSAMGNSLRQYIIPFWSFSEINMTRFINGQKNTITNMIESGRMSKDQATSLGFSYVQGTWKATKGVAKGMYVYASMMFIYGLIKTHNWGNHPEETEEYYKTDDHSRLGLILGKDENGEIQVLRFQGATSELLSWIGADNADMQDALLLIQAINKGETTMTDVSEMLLNGFTDKLKQSLGPHIKLPMEYAGGTDWYTGRELEEGDMTRKIAETYSAGFIYDWVTGAPMKGVGAEFEESIIYKADADMMNYWDIKQFEREYLEEEFGQKGGSGGSTMKSRFLYDYKRAIKFQKEYPSGHNKTAVKTAMNQLIEVFKSDIKHKDKSDVEIKKAVDEYIKNNLKTLSPMYHLAPYKKGLLWREINQDEDKLYKLDKAVKYYIEHLNPEAELSIEDVKMMIEINGLKGLIENGVQTDTEHHRFRNLNTKAKHAGLIKHSVWKTNFGIYNKNFKEGFSEYEEGFDY